MASLKSLKGRIASVKSTQKITKAMKMVAAAKLRRAQQAAEAGRPYAERMEAVMASLSAKVARSDQSPKLLAGTGRDQVHLLVVATSDRGLAGAFNSNIVRAARKKAEELIRDGRTVYFYLVGRKGRAVIQRLYPKQIVHQHDTTGIRQVSFADAQEIARDLVDRYITDGIDVVHLFYARFRSALVQEPLGKQIIPIPPAEEVSKYEAKQGDTLSKIAKEQLGDAALYARIFEANRDQLSSPDQIYVGMTLRIPTKAAHPATAHTSAAAIEYEPDEEEILAELLPRNVAVQIFRAMLENAASEQGSRMTAMDNATRNAGDMINRLTIQYNRTRQAAITTELVEIISGAEAL